MKKLSKKKISEAVAKWRGNWMKWGSFCWLRDKPDDSHDWCIVELSTRDSGIKDRSNASYFHKHMNPLVDDTTDVIEWSASHWVVGHTDGWACRVIDQQGRPTAAFIKLATLLAERDERDILDQQDYDQLLEQETRKNIEFYSRHCLPRGCSVKDERPDNWIDQVLDRLHEIDDCWEDDLDNDGVPAPNTDDLVQALEELGLLEREAA